MSKYIEFYKIIFTVIFIVISGCGSEPDADDIINSAIELHGGSNYKNSIIEFEFRGKDFQIFRNNNKFYYERTHTDTLENYVKERISNTGYTKLINDVEVMLDNKGKARIDGGVNSVVYFALLPFPLNDKAAQKKYIGSSMIFDNEYHKIEVTFKQEGGGRDYDDRFVYWINKNEMSMDYLAYEFHVNNGGTRFRKMYNPRRIGGILFTDHENFKSDVIKSNIEDYDQLFIKGELKKISDIKLEKIQVRKTE